MCGRYTLTTTMVRLQERFHCDATTLPYYTTSYNIAPGQEVLAVISDDTPRAGYLRWGLVPAWAKDAKLGYRMINARVETVAEKPSFRQALRHRRCLVLADGYFEWRRHGATKIPTYIHLQGHVPFAFAGLWETWRDAAGNPLHTCTILTTAANAFLSAIHPRMPVILSPEAEALWLDRQRQSPADLVPLLQPYSAAELQAYPVSQLVNTPQHNSPACIAPLAATN